MKTYFVHVDFNNPMGIQSLVIKVEAEDSVDAHVWVRDWVKSTFGREMEIKAIHCFER